jgi:hypothetical protein
MEIKRGHKLDIGANNLIKRRFTMSIFLYIYRKLTFTSIVVEVSEAELNNMDERGGRKGRCEEL